VLGTGGGGSGGGSRRARSVGLTAYTKIWVLGGTVVPQETQDSKIYNSDTTSDAFW